MKKIIFSLIVLVCSANLLAKDTYVNGYTKSNGTYVDGYHRSSPNSTMGKN